MTDDSPRERARRVRRESTSSHSLMALDKTDVNKTRVCLTDDIEGVRDTAATAMSDVRYLVGETAVFLFMVVQPVL